MILRLVAESVASLLEIQKDDLIKALTIRMMETKKGGRRGTLYEVPLNEVQANAVKGALAKSIYSRLFDWIVQKINQSLKQRVTSSLSLGVLDIYGFEIFQTNSFEQLCM